MIRRQRGFTLIELLVVIAIILILAAILFPVFAKVRAKALQTACINNLNQMGKAAEMYQGAWGDVLVPYGAPFGWPGPPTYGAMWPQLLDPYLKQIEGGKVVSGKMGKLFKCPAAVEEEETGFAFERSYGMNQALGGWMPGGAVTVVPVSKAKYPSQTIRLAEAEWKAQGGSFFAALPASYVPGDPTCHKLATRHNDVGEILWVDGHVSSMTLARYNSGPWLRLGGPKPQP